MRIRWVGGAMPSPVPTFLAGTGSAPGHSFLPSVPLLSFVLLVPALVLRPVGLRTWFLRQSYQCDHTISPRSEALRTKFGSEKPENGAFSPHPAPRTPHPAPRTPHLSMCQIYGRTPPWQSFLHLRRDIVCD
jgi:hypothetical protein